MSKYGVISDVRIFLYSDWIERFTSQISVFSANTGKYGPEINPCLDTFHAVHINRSLQDEFETHRELILVYILERPAAAEKF